MNFTQFSKVSETSRNIDVIQNYNFKTNFKPNMESSVIVIMTRYKETIMHSLF